MTGAALDALDGSGAGEVSRLDTHRGETVTVEAVGVDGARIGTVVLQEEGSGFTIDTVEIAPGVSPSDPAC
ncbi:hypothetical protein ESP50_01420 [Agromyces atrinae]|nr:hypothetical protein ESP50_01420 [Agromyces atrinae]